MDVPHSKSSEEGEGSMALSHIQKQICPPEELQQEEIEHCNENKIGHFESQNNENDGTKNLESNTSPRTMNMNHEEQSANALIQQGERETNEDELNTTSGQLSHACELTREAEDREQQPIATIITLSDGEDETLSMDAASKPGKILKRASVGAVNAGNEEERNRGKRRKTKVEGEPKKALTGYVRYMNDRRESARKENPSKTHVEITKLIGEEWQNLPSDIKAEYLRAAEEDKKRYSSELETFNKTRADVLANELAKSKKKKTDNTLVVNAALTTKQPTKEKIPPIDFIKSREANKDKQIANEVSPSRSQCLEKEQNCDKLKRKRTPTPPLTSASSSTSGATVGPSSAPSSNFATPAVVPTPGEIQIFTNEFLEHNKLYDMELRSLRKSKTDLEQQNFVLEKHVENMKCGVEKMVSENNELQEKNRLLEVYLEKLKHKLAVALASLPLPNAPNGATLENIEKYMQDLHRMSTSNSHGPATLNKAKDIIRKLDLQIQL